MGRNREEWNGRFQREPADFYLPPSETDTFFLPFFSLPVKKNGKEGGSDAWRLAIMDHRFPLISRATEHEYSRPSSSSFYVLHSRSFKKEERNGKLENSFESILFPQNFHITHIAIRCQRASISIEFFNGERMRNLKDFFSLRSGGGGGNSIATVADAGAATPASAIATSPWIPGRRKLLEVSYRSGADPSLLSSSKLFPRGGILFLFFPSFLPFLSSQLILRPRRISLIAPSFLLVVLVVLFAMVDYPSKIMVENST